MLTTAKNLLATLTRVLAYFARPPYSTSILVSQRPVLSGRSLAKTVAEPLRNLGIFTVFVNALWSNWNISSQSIRFRKNRTGARGYRMALVLCEFVALIHTIRPRKQDYNWTEKNHETMDTCHEQKQWNRSTDCNYSLFLAFVRCIREFLQRPSKRNSITRTYTFFRVFKINIVKSEL